MMEKVRSLLALAENAGTEAEAERARERAEALMMKFSIDEAMLGDKGEVKEEIDKREIKLDAPYAKEKSLLLGTVAHYNSVRVIVHTRGRGYGRGAFCTIIGFPSDMERVEVLFTSLLLQASRDVMKQEPPQRYSWDGSPRRREDTATYRSSWMLGFNTGVSERMERIRRHTQQQVDAENTGGRGTELVLRDRKTQVDDAVTELYPKLKNMSVSSSGSGRSRGYEAGQKADLGQTRFAGSRTQLPGS